jgi:uncharacterized protein (TIGR02145 family)
VINSQEIEEKTDIKRNSLYNLEEIKVRWKKAALENCPGVPCVTTLSFTCGTSTVSDMDGNSYNTVLIGDQCWTRENLRVRKYNDGTPIPFDNTGLSVGTSATWQNLTVGTYTLYEHDSTATPSNLNNYGYLYNWYAAAGIVTNLGSPTKNICPTGWHVPSDGEWTTLTTYLDGLPVAGGKMKSTSSLWNSPNTGANNSSGFTALPGGYRNSLGTFRHVGDDSYFWSATEDGTTGNSWEYGMEYNVNSVYRYDSSKSGGNSVRCLRN